MQRFETAKAAVELPCPWDGTVVQLLAEPGQMFADACRHHTAVLFTDLIHDQVSLTN